MSLMEEKQKRELLNERQKVTNRWFIFVILFVVFLVISVRGTIPLLTATFLPLAVSGALANGFFHILFLRVSAVPSWVKYATVAFDMAVASVVILVTGGPYSVFYSLYFIILISNAFRYGMGMSMYVALLENLMYPVILWIWGGLPDASRVFSFEASALHYSLLLEGSKILVFWGVALYAGYLSSRLKRQANEILGLYERIHELEDQSKPGHAGPP
ncbi:MAG: hypothetical protein ACREJQ_04205 [bacterium]